MLRQEAGEIAGGKGHRIVAGVVGQHLFHHLTGVVEGGAHLEIVVAALHLSAHGPPAGPYMCVSVAVPDGVGVAALSPVAGAHLRVEGPEGQVYPLEPAGLVGLLQPVGGEPAALDPLGEVALGCLPVHPEGHHPVRRHTGPLPVLQQLGGAAHGAHCGGAVLIYRDLCAAAAAGDHRVVRKGHPLPLPRGIPVKIMLLYPLYRGLRHIRGPAGGALQPLPRDAPLDGAAAVGAHLPVHLFPVFRAHRPTHFPDISVSPSIGRSIIP